MQKSNLADTAKYQEAPLIDNQLFQAIFNDSPDAVFILDANYRIIENNNKALKLFEVEESKGLIDVPYLQLYASEPIEINQHLANSELLENGVYTQELAFRTFKDNIFWGRIIKKSLKVSGNDIVVLRITKVVDYLRAEEAMSALLKGTSRLTGKLFLKELTKLLCRTFDTKYAFIGKMKGNNKEELQIIQMWEGNEEAEEFTVQISGSCTQNVLKGYTSYYPVKLEEMFPDDKMVQSKRVESFLGTPLFDAAGKPVGLLAVMDCKQMNEIPNARYILSIFASRVAAELQRIKSKELLREQTRKLAAANQMKDKFLSVIAHDLKNPFHTVLGFSELLRKKSKDYSKEQIQEKTEIIDNSIRNIYCLLENLIDWSKLERDAHKLQIQEVNLYDLIQDNIELFQYITDVKSIRISNIVPENTVIKADKYSTNSIIRNLLSNAIKFNYKNGKVDISITEDKAKVIILVKDEGIGISDDEGKLIFNDTKDFKKEGTLEEKGTGLGLIISKKLAEQQGGKIWLNNKLEKGTAFYFSIPK